MAKGKSLQPSRTGHRFAVWNTRAMASEAGALHGVRRIGRLTVYPTKGHAQDHAHGDSRRRKRVAEHPKTEAESKPAAADAEKAEAPSREAKPVAATTAAVPPSGRFVPRSG